MAVIRLACAGTISNKAMAKKGCPFPCCKAKHFYTTQTSKCFNYIRELGAGPLWPAGVACHSVDFGRGPSHCNHQQRTRHMPPPARAFICASPGGVFRVSNASGTGAQVPACSYLALAKTAVPAPPTSKLVICQFAGVSVARA